MTDTTLIAGDAPAVEQPPTSSQRPSTRHRRHEPAMGPAPAAPQYESEDLLAGGEEALIRHREETYRLRKTWTGKLILTK